MPEDFNNEERLETIQSGEHLPSKLDMMPKADNSKEAVPQQVGEMKQEPNTTNPIVEAFRNAHSFDNLKEYVPSQENGDMKQGENLESQGENSESFPEA